MLFTDLIRKKRDRGALTKEEIQFFADGLADGSIPAEQVSAMAMAICLNSMSFDEAATLTLAMANSGEVLDWSAESLDGPVVDKHSTGGVGDKVSFLLAPIAAACGCFVPMISGQGLGHTGGTTDKAESIPGYNVAPDFAEFRRVVRKVGCAVIGQTEDLAPADRRFYAIRDVTSTIESIPLITASILSKKIAAGLDALVMDVKVGNGAFMKSADRAADLSKSIIATAATAGLKTHALITDMNEVLGRTAGNALEISEAVMYLRNETRESRLDEVVMALCSQMLIATGQESDVREASAKVDDAVTSGRAAEVFSNMVVELGGPADLLENSEKHLPMAAIHRAVSGHQNGYISAVDTMRVGNAIIELGGGRRKLGDSLDLSVGFSDILSIGTRVEAGQALATVHAASEDTASLAAELFIDACVISDIAPPQRPVVYLTLTED